MRLKKTFVTGTMLAGAMTALSFMSAGAAQAQGALVMYCGVQEEWCRAMVNAFEQRDRNQGLHDPQERRRDLCPGQGGSRQSRAPTSGGAARATRIMQAAEEGLTVEYKSPKMSELQDWALRQWEQSKQRTVGIYSGALGFGYNTELAEGEEASREPKCWADLLKPELRTRCRSPTRTPPARPTRCSPRSCRSWARTRASTT